MNRRSLLKCVPLSASFLLKPRSTRAQGHAGNRVAMILDTSGSMTKRIATLIEATKLMCVLLDGTIHPVPFNETARADAPLRLDSDDARRAAMAYFARL